MIFLKQALNLAAQKDLPAIYARRFDDWLRAPLSMASQLESNDYFLGLKLEKAFTALSKSSGFTAMYSAHPETLSIPVFLKKFEDEELKGADGVYSPFERAIAIDFDHTKNNYLKLDLANLVSILSHEYRHAYQHHIQISHKMLNILSEDPILAGFFMEADAVAFQILVCFEIYNETGNKAHLNNVQSRYEKQTDAFLRAISNGQTKGEAQTKAFEAWFTDTNTVNFYHEKEFKHIANFFEKDTIINRVFSEKVREQFEKWKHSPKQKILTAPFKNPQQLSFNFLHAAKQKHKENCDKKPVLMPQINDDGLIVNNHDYLSDSMLFKVSNDYFLHQVKCGKNKDMQDIAKSVQKHTESTLERFEKFSKSKHNILKIKNKNPPCA